MVFPQSFLNEQFQEVLDASLFFIGDLIDKGPDSVGVVKYAFELSKIYSTNLVLGNHEEKLLRYLYNKDNNYFRPHYVS